MPRIVDMSKIYSPAEWQAIRPQIERENYQWRAKKEGEWIGSQRQALRIVLGVKWRWRCAYCACPVNSDCPEVAREYFPEIRDWTDDHIVPKCHGGRYTANNIVPSCKSCNSKRGHAPVRAYLASRGFSEAEIEEWLKYQPFHPVTESMVNLTLIQIRDGCRLSSKDVSWLQSLGFMSRDPKHELMDLCGMLTSGRPREG